MDESARGNGNGISANRPYATRPMARRFPSRSVTSSSGGIPAQAAQLPFEDAHFDVCWVPFGLHGRPVGVRQQALLEMARVTKPNGKLVIVDYALPENPIASRLVYHLVKLYEPDNYAEFVRSDLHAMLDRAGLAAKDRSTSGAWEPRCGGGVRR